ncbi:MAG: outer membrane protein transport protein [Burkholderiaceae bacterium]
MSAAKLRAIAVAIACLSPAVAFATNGYFSHGYGMKAKGMAGVGIALPVDGLAPATNPAGIAFLGNRLDLGLDMFRPNRGGEITGNNGVPAFGVPSLDGQYNGNGIAGFLIPELGYTRQLGERMALGLAIYGNGGMNSTYNQSPFTMMGGPSPAGVDLNQLFVSPTFAMKLGENHALGVSVNFAYQQFEAVGLQPFGGFGLSSDPTRLTNNGIDTATGWGMRIGWTGRLSNTITMGATYQSKTRMSKFEQYAGLFAGQGQFDIPANYGIGIAADMGSGITLAADIQHIKYSDIAAIANPLSNMNLGARLGDGNGPGFGWRDMTVFKLGVSVEASSRLTFRGGYSHGRQPIPAGETFFNMLAPGVMEDHITVGATWKLDSGNELTFAFMHAFRKDVRGSNSIPPNFGGGEANLHMTQNSLGIAYGIKF